LRRRISGADHGIAGGQEIAAGGIVEKRIACKGGGTFGMRGTKERSFEPDELREVQISSELVYKGRILNLRVDQVKLPGGRIRSREVVEHNKAVVVLAENDCGEILLINQFR
jgi:hypothetical protein